MTWGGLLGFCLLMGSLSGALDRGSSPEGFRRRILAPLALGAFGLLLLARLVLRRAGLDLPAPSAVPALVVGVLAVAVPVWATLRFGPQSPWRERRG